MTQDSKDGSLPRSGIDSEVSQLRAKMIRRVQASAILLLLCAVMIVLLLNPDEPGTVWRLTFGFVSVVLIWSIGWILGALYQLWELRNA